jgi:hypothetical protein
MWKGVQEFFTHTQNYVEQIKVNGEFYFYLYLLGT